MPFTLLGCSLQHPWVVLELPLKLLLEAGKKLQLLQYFSCCFMSSAALFSWSDAFVQGDPQLRGSSSRVTL